MSIAAVGAVGATTAASAATRVSPETKKAAEGFEKLLLNELTKVVAENAMPDDATMQGRMSDALTDAMMAGGGLGLAAQIAPTLEARS